MAAEAELDVMLQAGAHKRSSRTWPRRWRGRVVRLLDAHAVRVVVPVVQVLQVRPRLGVRVAQHAEDPAPTVEKVQAGRHIGVTSMGYIIH